MDGLERDAVDGGGVTDDASRAGVSIAVDPHPLLVLAWFVTDFGAPLKGIPSPPWLVDLLRIDAELEMPLRRSEEVRVAVRDLLRHGGYKPTGRGKPASEYLVRAATEGVLGPINAAVDVCNAVSLHSGLPMSLVDLDRLTPPLRVGIAAKGEHYVFNASGQEMDLGGLLCLFDREGPCANGVKDSQRTKTTEATTRTLTLIWAPKTHPPAAARTASIELYAALK